MNLREYKQNDFKMIEKWIEDEKTHAMWCANRFQFPLDENNFSEVLLDAHAKSGDLAFVATTDDGDVAGFFVYSLNSDTKESLLKFVVVNPKYRGKGIIYEMLKLAMKYAFVNTGAEAVQLNVFSENARAMKSYIKAGFQIRKTTDKAFAFKDEVWGRCNMVVKREQI